MFATLTWSVLKENKKCRWEIVDGLERYNQKTEYDSLEEIGGGIFDIFAGLPLFVFIKEGITLVELRRDILLESSVIILGYEFILSRFINDYD